MVSIIIADDQRLLQESLQTILMMEGYTNRQISSTLFMSEGTVRNSISVIYNKLGTSDRQGAISILKGLLPE